MPYVEASKWFDTRIEPTDGETFAMFRNRILPALTGLAPETNIAEHEQTLKDAWAAYLFGNATEITLTLKRELETYNSPWYFEAYYGDWRVDEVLSAKTLNLDASVSGVEMATAATGDVFKIAKSVQDEQLVFGWANIAIDENGQYPIDWDGDITDPSDLEKAAYNFVLKHRVTGEQHQGEVKGQLVESVMFTKEKQTALGIPEGIIPEGWWVGFHVPDAEVFAKIKSGEYQMFSVEGSAIRQPTAEGGE